MKNLTATSPLLNRLCAKGIDLLQFVAVRSISLLYSVTYACTYTIYAPLVAVRFEPGAPLTATNCYSPRVSKCNIFTHSYTLVIYTYSTHIAASRNTPIPSAIFEDYANAPRPIAVAWWRSLRDDLAGCVETVRQNVTTPSKRGSSRARRTRLSIY